MKEHLKVIMREMEIKVLSRYMSVCSCVHMYRVKCFILYNMTGEGIPIYSEEHGKDFCIYLYIVLVFTNCVLVLCVHACVGACVCMCTCAH